MTSAISYLITRYVTGCATALSVRGRRLVEGVPAQLSHRISYFGFSVRQLLCQFPQSASWDDGGGAVIDLRDAAVAIGADPPAATVYPVV